MFKKISKTVLLKLLKWVETEPRGSAVKRGGENAWEKEIFIPSPVVAALSVAAFFVILLLEVGFVWVKVAGLVLFITMVFAFFVVYLKYDIPELLADGEAMMLLGLLLTSSVLTMQVMKGWPLAVPIAAFVVLTGLLLSKRLAIISAIVLSLVLGILNDFGLEYFFVHIAGSFTGVTFLSGIRNRADLTRLGLKIAAANVGAILIIHMFGLWSLHVLKINLIFGALSG